MKNNKPEKRHSINERKEATPHPHREINHA
jgi:hypothetical protein